MPESTPKTGRRGLLKGAAASALATSAVVFGSPGKAGAGEAPCYSFACCCLYFSPGSWSTCTTGNYYVWSCYYNPEHYVYRCCERLNANGNAIYSAYHAWHA